MYHPLREIAGLSERSRIIYELREYSLLKQKCPTIR